MTTADDSAKAEARRLDEERRGTPWKKWGPYLSERQWGTVREDYGNSPNSWAHFPHEQARSRAYRWGEDGIAGFSDDQQLLCFALALHNGKDPILKERLFGLANEEGNHGEDVKEYYYYLDATPTHSYQRLLYKYPQSSYPYANLVEENARRSRQEPEYELIDTGVFEEDRYFDVQVEYAKASPEDILIRIRVDNRGPDSAALRLLPTLWFRNTWRWNHASHPEPRIEGANPAVATHDALGALELHCEPGPEASSAPPLLYTDNETNRARLFQSENPTRFVKDGINDYVVAGAPSINPKACGTKVAADYSLNVPAGESVVVRLRLARQGLLPAKPSVSEVFEGFDSLVEQRRLEADRFHGELLPTGATEDERRVARQALAGMLWGKQYYEYDVQRWLGEHHGQALRNRNWRHLRCRDIISMPDKWEYPWFATWDLAFHLIALFYVDPDFAREQCLLLLGERYQHPNGALPAYEWNFDDVNPPVMPFAVLTIHNILLERGAGGDRDFLRQAFPGLERNFEWWRTHKDPSGDWTFQGGFLGLDNIGVFDRSKPLPTGGHLEQADASGWMALFAQFMLRISIALAVDDTKYEQHAIRYLEAAIRIGQAMDRDGEHADEMWDSEDGFFYDVLRFTDGGGTRMRVRSMVGLLPLCASTVLSAGALERLPRLRARLDELCGACGVSAHLNLTTRQGEAGTRLVAVVDEAKLRRILERLLDEDEFLGPYGIRSLSKAHGSEPYTFEWAGQQHSVGYLPAESDSGMFGGNSNWRGPVWAPVNYLLLRALVQLHEYFGDDFRVACPARSPNQLNLKQVAHELASRLERTFLRGADGRRPVFGGSDKFQADPHFRDHLLFYEYFHGDNGAGIGASHQTGWTGLVAVTMAARARSEGLYR